VAEDLKKTTRYLIRKKINRESAADHSWKAALMVFILAEELNLKIDKEKALKLAIIHDLAEAITGDIDYGLIVSGKVKEKDKRAGERRAMRRLARMLPARAGKEIADLWLEYEQQKTGEAKFVKAIDKLETISHLIKIGYPGFANDRPEIIPNYADKSVSQFPELVGFSNQLKKNLKKEFLRGKLQWKNEYGLF
jgi:5'-deoxynucleotidase YfbR-like HD superfamily hydrolase